MRTNIHQYLFASALSIKEQRLMCNAEIPKQRDFSPENKQKSQEIVDGKKEKLPDFIGKTLELINRISAFIQNKDVQEKIRSLFPVNNLIAKQAIELKNAINSQSDMDVLDTTYFQPNAGKVQDHVALAYKIKEASKENGGISISVEKKDEVDSDTFYSQVEILAQSLKGKDVGVILLKDGEDGIEIRVTKKVPKVLPVLAKEEEKEKAPLASVVRASAATKSFNRPKTPKAPMEEPVESVPKSASANTTNENSKTPLQKKQEYYDPANPDSPLPPSHRFGNAILGSDNKAYLVRNRFARGVTWWEKMELKGDMTDSLEKRRESNWVQISKDDPLVAAKMAQVRQWMPDVASRAEKVQPKQVWQPGQVRNMPYNVDAKYKHGFQRPGDNARINKWG